MKIVLYIVLILTLNWFPESLAIDTKSEIPPFNIFIDTDIGSDVDDALALLTVLGHSEINVLGISTVNGDTQKRALIALRVLELAERQAIPVSAGISSTLLRKKQPRNWDKELAQHLDRDPETQIDKRHGVDHFIETVHENPGLTVIALGPLTNIALAIIKDPTIIHKIGQLVVVGGVVKLPSSNESGSIFVDYKSEYNLNCDPDSAKIVFESGVPLIMSGLEPALQVTLNADTALHWQKNKTPLASWTAQRVFERLISHHSKETHLGDVVGVLAVLDPQTVTIKELPIHIELWGETLRTVVDPTGSGHKVKVVLSVNKREFEHSFKASIDKVLRAERNK